MPTYFYQSIARIIKGKVEQYDRVAGFMVEYVGKKNIFDYVDLIVIPIYIIQTNEYALVLVHI
jgi:hypothetical protein